MLKADQIELAILTLVLEHPDVSGPTILLHTLEQRLSRTIDRVSQREIVEVLLVLYDNNIIALGRYEGRVLVPYDRHEGIEYFYYGGGFRCTALPNARRRQQELSKGNRYGIFVSHVSEERPMALRMQRLFRESLSEGLPVFVSSDYKSVKSGDPWYDTTLAGLRKSQAVVVLLSHSSIDHRWINFECGIGIGQETSILPVVWRGLTPTDVGMPLGHVQVLHLDKYEDLKAVLQHLAAICGTPFNETHIATFLQDLPELAAIVPNVGLCASLFREGRRVRLAIQNTGTRLLELTEAEMLISDTLSGDNNFQEYQPVLQRRYVTEGGVRYVGNALTKDPSHMLHLGINPLRQMLAPGPEYVPDHLGVNLPTRMTPADEALSVRFMVSSKQHVFGPVAIPISQIPDRSV